MALFKAKSFNLASSLGSRGEKAAENYLKKCGYKILETNFCNITGRRMGEIDIIAKDGEEIVFVEVKTRTITNKFAPLPQESITRAKLYKLNKIATYYLAKNRLSDNPFRFDALCLIADPTTNSAKLQHLKNVFI